MTKVMPKQKSGISTDILAVVSAKKNGEWRMENGKLTACSGDEDGFACHARGNQITVTTVQNAVLAAQLVRREGVVAGDDVENPTLPPHKGGDGFGIFDAEDASGEVGDEALRGVEMGVCVELPNTVTLAYQPKSTRLQNGSRGLVDIIDS